MKQRLQATLIGMTFAAAAAAATATANASEPVDLRFGTVGVGSAWYNYGAGIAELVLPNLPEGSNIDVMPVAGGVGNIKMIESGEAELGISFANTTADACAGRGSFDQPHQNVRGLMGGLDIYYLGTFVTQRSGAESWEDIVAAKNGFRLLTAGVGGTGELGVRQVLEVMGSDYDDVASKGGSVRAMDRAATASAIADGSAEGWAHVVTKGHPAATELTTSADMTVLPLPAEVISGMVDRFGWVETTMPANLFRGQTEDVTTVMTASNILVSADVPEEVVYQIAKTIIENAERLPGIHAALADFDPQKAVNPQLVGNCPWHPGAERAFREAGLM
jgi:uncharacterized protein